MNTTANIVAIDISLTAEINMENQDLYMKVYCQYCQEYHSTDEVEFVNIEEDIYGRDVMTFICPETQETTSSNVYSSPC